MSFRLLPADTPHPVIDCQRQHQCCRGSTTQGRLNLKCATKRFHPLPDAEEAEFGGESARGSFSWHSGRIGFETCAFIPHDDLQLTIALFEGNRGLAGTRILRGVDEQLTYRLEYQHRLILGQ